MYSQAIRHTLETSNRVTDPLRLFCSAEASGDRLVAAAGGAPGLELDHLGGLLGDRRGIPLGPGAADAGVEVDVEEQPEGEDGDRYQRVAPVGERREQHDRREERGPEPEDHDRAPWTV